MGIIKGTRKDNRINTTSGLLTKKINSFLPFFIFFSFWYGIYYAFNINTPLFADDEILKFIWHGWNLEKTDVQFVTNIRQIIDGMKLYYNIERGRIIPFGLGQLFAVYGKQYFNILNSLMFTGIISLVYFHSNYGKKSNWFLYLSVCGAFWILTPKLMPTTLWMIGSLNECWPIFFVLLFLVPYRKMIVDSYHLKHPIITTIFVIPAGFLAGAFNYQSSGLALGFSALAVLMLFFKKRNVPFWSIIGLISTMIGTLFILLAPGNKSGANYGGSESLLLRYLESFPGNIFNAIAVSVSITIVQLLFTVIIVTWLLKDINNTASAGSQVKKQEKRIKKRRSIEVLLDENNEYVLPTLFITNVFSYLVLFTTYALMGEQLIYKVFSSIAIVVFVCTEILCVQQIVWMKFASHRERKKSRKSKDISVESLVNNKNDLLIPCMFLFTTLFSVAIHSALPYFDERLFFTVFVSFSLFFFSLLSEASERIRHSKWKLKGLRSNKYMRVAVPAMICLILVFDVGNEFRVYHRDFVIYQSFVASIEEKVASGEKDIILPSKPEIRKKLLENGRIHSFIYYWSIGDHWSVGDGGIFDNEWFAFCRGADKITNSENPITQ